MGRMILPYIMENKSHVPNHQQSHGNLRKSLHQSLAPASCCFIACTVFAMPRGKRCTSAKHWAELGRPVSGVARADMASSAKRRRVVQAVT